MTPLMKNNMPKTIIFATKNEAKLIEIREFFGDGFNILSPIDLGLDFDINEDGKTFEENAIKKANALCDICNELVMADDSGLEISALNGNPGVDSAYFMGGNTPYAKRNEAIWSIMQNVALRERLARFVCVIAVARPKSLGAMPQDSGAKPQDLGARPQDAGASTTTFKASVDGLICTPTASGGFGYDPIFYIPKYKMTMAQMDTKTKNTISHRAKALKLAYSAVCGDAL